MELGWWKRDEENGKQQVLLKVFGGKIFWRRQMKRFEPWQDYPNPDEEDWDRAIELAENRLQRRLTTKKVVDMIRQRGKDPGGSQEKS